MKNPNRIPEQHGFTDGGYAYTASFDHTGWSFSADNFPGGNAMGDTFKEGRESLEEIIGALIEIYTEQGQSYPQPTEPRAHATAA